MRFFHVAWTEEPGGLQSTGSQRVRHDFTFTFAFHVAFVFMSISHLFIHLPVDGHLDSFQCLAIIHNNNVAINILLLTHDPFTPYSNHMR